MVNKRKKRRPGQISLKEFEALERQAQVLSYTSAVQFKPVSTRYKGMYRPLPKAPSDVSSNETSLLDVRWGLDR